MTYQVGPEGFDNRPDIPILQPLSDLQVVVIRSAANLAGGQCRGGFAHIGGDGGDGCGGGGGGGGSERGGGDGGGWRLSLNVVSNKTKTNMSCARITD